MISSTLGSTVTNNPYQPVQGGLPSLNGGNIAELINALLARRRQASASARPVARPQGFLNSAGNNNLDALREEMLARQMRAEISGPNKVLVPTGYGHMLQEDTSSLPWSMRPDDVRIQGETPSDFGAERYDMASADPYFSNAQNNRPRSTLQPLGSGERPYSNMTLAEMIRSGRY